MRQVNRFHVPAFLLIIAMLIAGGHAQGADWEEVDAALDRVVDSLRLDGAALLVYKDGKMLCEEYVNDHLISTTPYHPYTKINIASASKWMVTALMLDLEELGWLSIEDPVAAYIPTFNQPMKEEITIEHCLANTSGFPPGIYIGCLANRYTSLKQCTNWIANNIPLYHPPGECFCYGSGSWQVAGRVAEVAARGRPGIPSTYTFVDVFNDRINRVLGTHMLWDMQMPKTKNPRIGGGIYATAPECMEFLKTYLHDYLDGHHRMLSRQSIAKMLRCHSCGLDNCRDDGVLTNEYGLGCWLPHGSLYDSPSISSDGRYGVVPWIDWGRGYAGLFFTNKNIDFELLHTWVWYYLIPVINLQIDDAT